MRSKFAYMALAATFSFVAFANTASANLVYNGSFELNSGTYTTPTGWDFIPASYGSDTPQDVTYFDGLTPEDGSWFLAFGAVGGEDDYFGQTISDTAGQTYLLTYWGSTNYPYDEEDAAMWNGTVVSEEAVSSVDSWTEYSVDVVGTGSDYLEVGGQNGPSWNGLDNVSLTSTTPGPVAIAPFAMGALAAFRRRNRR